VHEYASELTSIPKVFPNPKPVFLAIFYFPKPVVKVSRNGPERRSGKIIIAGTAFRLEYLVGWCYDADTTMAEPELY